MKILVCTDRSGECKEALEEAPAIAERYNPDEVAIIHVYQAQESITPMGYVTKERLDELTNLQEQHKEEADKLLSDAQEVFEKKNIKARKSWPKGHPLNLPLMLLQRWF